MLNRFDIKELINTDVTEQTNLLIKGDNLLVMQALVPFKGEKVKLIYIDPPYNTGGSKFGYNDNRTRHEWISFMKERLILAKDFLMPEGTIFIHCDDSEQAYLKVLCDEIFGERNFIATIIWHSISSVLKRSKFVRKDHEYILVYAKDKTKASFNKTENNILFSNPDNDVKGEWFSSNASHPNQTSNKNRFAIKMPNGGECVRNWKFSYDDYKEGKVTMHFKGNNVPRMKIYKSEYEVFSKTESSIFTDLGSITSAKRELEKLFGEIIFDTPKPEILLKRVIEIASNKGDLVMDFFAGSGTTCAVAHKMRRQWIGIEQMDYIDTLTKERLIKVIGGEQGGVSKKVAFKGGGNFAFLELKELNDGIQ